MTFPLVSIILPTFNRGHLLSRSIVSVLKQTYKDWELIIVDDGSTDGTENLVKSFEDGRINYIRTPGPQGVAAARNLGLSRAKGDLIAFQDSDDEWFHEKLQLQVKRLNELPQEVAMVYSSMVRVKMDGEELINLTPKFEHDEPNTFERALKLEVFGIGIQSSLLKKEAFSKAGSFDCRLKRFVDLEFFIRLAKVFQFQCIEKPLVRYHETQNSISCNEEAGYEAEKVIFNKYEKEISLNPNLLSFYCQRQTDMALKRKDFHHVRYLLRKSIFSGIKKPSEYRHIIFLNKFAEYFYTKARSYWRIKNMMRDFFKDPYSQKLSKLLCRRPAKEAVNRGKL